LLRLRARLRRLEARLTDGSGLRPRSPEWLEHWTLRLNKILSGEETGAPRCIPLEVWDAVDAAPGEHTQDLSQITTFRALATGEGSYR
jgi:hypothetical protein